MYDLSISQFGLQLVNQQREINDCIFRLFDSYKYLITLRSIISPCQTATTLILVPLYNPSFHLSKPSKKYLGTAVFLSWMPFKICDCDKLPSVILCAGFYKLQMASASAIIFAEFHDLFCVHVKRFKTFVN